MLKLTRQIEYALIAVRHMEKKRGTLSSAREISDSYMIPKELLAKTLQKMAKLNYLNAVQGSHAGYYLNKNMDEITLTRFIEDLEGPLGIVDCNINYECEQLDTCNIKGPINKINNKFLKFLNQISISEITK